MKNDRFSGCFLPSLPVLIAVLLVCAQSTLYAKDITTSVKNTVVATVGPFTDPQGVTVTSDSQYVYFVDEATNLLWVLDAQSQLVINSGNYVGPSPWGVALSPDDQSLYVTNEVSPGTLQIVSTANLALSTVTGLGDYPEGLAVSPNGKEVYIANSGTKSDSVSRYDTALGVLLDPVPVGRNPGWVAFTPKGGFAYVTNSFGSNVSVINVSLVYVAAKIKVGQIPGSISIAPNAFRAYAINAQSVSIIDVQKNVVTHTIDLSSLGIGTTYVAALTPDGRYLYVPANSDTPGAPGSVIVISTATEKVVGSQVQVGNQPNQIAIAPNGEFAYVTNGGTTANVGTLTIIQIQE